MRHPARASTADSCRHLACCDIGPPAAGYLRHSMTPTTCHPAVHTTQALERIAGLLEEAGGGGLVIAERGDAEGVPRHPGFRLFGAMNPATDAGARPWRPGLGRVSSVQRRSTLDGCSRQAASARLPVVDRSMPALRFLPTCRQARPAGPAAQPLHRDLGGRAAAGERHTSLPPALFGRILAQLPAGPPPVNTPVSRPPCNVQAVGRPFPTCL